MMPAGIGDEPSSAKAPTPAPAEPAATPARQSIFAQQWSRPLYESDANDAEESAGDAEESAGDAAESAGDAAAPAPAVAQPAQPPAEDVAAWRPVEKMESADAESESVELLPEPAGEKPAGVDFLEEPVEDSGLMWLAQAENPLNPIDPAKRPIPADPATPAEPATSAEPATPDADVPAEGDEEPAAHLTRGDRWLYSPTRLKRSIRRYSVAAWILGFVVLVLAWIVFGFMMRTGFLPTFNLGYQWFDSHVFYFFGIVKSV